MHDCCLSILPFFITILLLLSSIQPPPCLHDFPLRLIALFQICHLELPTFFPQAHLIPPQFFHLNQLLSLDLPPLSCSTSI